MANILPNSTLAYILKGLVPYTAANTKLVFKPRLFFRDLEQISNRKKRTLQNVYYRAHKAGYLFYGEDRTPRLAARGHKAMAHINVRKMDGTHQLLVVFDIPESKANARRRLRYVLRISGFEQVQKSVWSSSFDHKAQLREYARHMNIDEHVKFYKAELQ